MPAKTKKKSLYRPHPSIAYAQSVVANMKSKTGRSLDEWVALTNRQGPKTESERHAWLKKTHGLGMNYAGYIAAASLGKGGDATDPDQYLRAAEKYVEDMYAGPKAGLKPLYDKLLDVAFDLAKDVKACPCQTMVPLFREHVIAQIKPSTRTRIDFGLALGKHQGKLPKRLIDTGGAAKKDRITHKIELTSLEQVDDDLVRWLKVAYDLDG